MELSYKWRLADLAEVPKNGLKVFSCFSCGGGSSMGYKLAGYEVLGNCEIDPETNATYVANNHPEFNFCMDIREFAKLEEYPPPLLDLDVLDGSPPCTTFSVAGSRERSWGVEKKFAEGQAKQRLDDLFFPFIEVARRLQPKVVIAENVKGLSFGNARGYIHEIVEAFRVAGYECQIFLLNAATMGVPQKRERVFFVCQRRDLALPKLRLEFNERPVLFGEFRSPEGRPVTPAVAKLLSHRQPTDKKLSYINLRLYNKDTGYTNMIVRDDQLCWTVASGGEYYRYTDGLAFSELDYIHVASFPEDYDFGKKDAHFITGMSVPPLMMARVAGEVAKQWFNK